VYKPICLERSRITKVET
ncbi:hypothetical protein CISIN_1g0209141mg, partial [Citrus sinensis]